MAFTVKDLAETERFYCQLLGCAKGRQAERWLDINFFGHQLSAHLGPVSPPEAFNTVDGKQVPTRHFGAILPMQEWKALRDRLAPHNLRYVIAPYIRFEGKIGEQATMFFLDPSGNAIEIKGFEDETQIFAIGNDHYG